MKIKIKNKTLRKIGEIADREGYNVFVVGGYVRDLLLGKESADIDIMITGEGIKFAELVANEYDKKPDAIYKNFETALLNLEDVKLEFATARVESYQKNSRKPEVKPGTLNEDLSRRDFTINALAISLNSKTLGEVYDEYNGADDLKNGIIRTPLDPLRTFEDDPLRILRAIRFASRFDFKIEEKTFEGLCTKKDRLIGSEIVSQERISNEFLQILMTDKPSVGLELLHLSGVMQVIFPEISMLDGVDQRQDYHHKNVFYHTLMVVDNICKTTDDVWLRFAALVHDIAKPKTKKLVDGIGWTFHGHEEMGARMMKSIFRRMKLPMYKLEYVEKLVRMHLRPIPISMDVVGDSAVRRLAADAGDELVDLLKLCRADITSKNPELVKKYLKNYEIVEKRIVEVQEKDHLRNFRSPVRGEEIMEVFGIEPGRQVGIIKHRIEEAILEGKIPNEYEPAREFMMKNFKEMLK